MQSEPPDDAPRLTIIDVLENALDGDLTRGAIDRLDLAEIAALAESVQDFYESWQPPVTAEGQLRVHLGGWVAGNLDHAGARDLLHTALVYAHEVILHDPVAAYFEPRRAALRGLPAIRHRSGMQIQSSQGHYEASGGWVNAPNLEGARSYLGMAIEGLAPLAPLIRCGAAVPVPHLRIALDRQQGVLSAVRHMISDERFRHAVEQPVDGPPLTSDEAHGFRVLTEPLKSRADVLNQNFGPVAFYLARTLAIAEASGASYLPPSATDWALYENRLERVLAPALDRRAHVDLRVASAVGRSELPLLQGLDSSIVAKIHADEAAFEDWRRALRRFVKHVETSTSEGAAFEAESRQVLDDELTPMVEEVVKAVRRSRVLREQSRDAKITLASGVAIAGGAASAGLVPAAAMATAAGSALATWLLKALFPKRQEGARAVVAHLLGATGNPGSLPRPDEALVLRPKDE
jgi:hypothetical protein